tara:strand:+ start:147 stop:323 length:177 start_codon:yes stop_codon:yes gene_type:complete
MTNQTEKRTFLICDDDSENFFVGRFTRQRGEVKPELWSLKIGQFIPGETANMSITREK